MKLYAVVSEIVIDGKKEHSFLYGPAENPDDAADRVAEQLMQSEPAISNIKHMAIEAVPDDMIRMVAADLPPAEVAPPPDVVEGPNVYRRGDLVAFLHKWNVVHVYCPGERGGQIVWWVGSRFKDMGGLTEAEIAAHAERAFGPGRLVEEDRGTPLGTHFRWDLDKVPETVATHANGDAEILAAWKAAQEASDNWCEADDDLDDANYDLTETIKRLYPGVACGDHISLNGRLFKVTDNADGNFWLSELVPTVERGAA